jgi:DedD protein
MADSEDKLNFKKRAKRRIVGAVALVIFVAIALPMVFDKEPKPLSSDISIQIPNPDSNAFKNQVVPVPPPAPGQAMPAPAPVAASTAPATTPMPKSMAPALPPAPPPLVSGPAPKAVTAPAPIAAKLQPEAAKSAVAAATPAPQTKAASVPPVPPIAAKSAPASVPAPAPAPAVEAKAAPHPGWGVKLGTFADAENVKRLRDKLSAAGVKSTTESLDTSQGAQTRVWAGPYPNKAAAERARDHLKKLGYAGVVAEK